MVPFDGCMSDLSKSVNVIFEMFIVSLVWIVFVFQQKFVKLDMIFEEIDSTYKTAIWKPQYRHLDIDIGIHIFQFLVNNIFTDAFCEKVT